MAQGAAEAERRSGYHRRCRGLCRRSRPARLPPRRAGRRQSFPQPRPLSLELHAASTVAPLLCQTIQYYTTAARCSSSWFRLLSLPAPIAARLAPPSRKPQPLPVPPHRSPAVTNGCSQPNARSRVLCPGIPRAQWASPGQAPQWRRSPPIRLDCHTIGHSSTGSDSLGALEPWASRSFLSCVLLAAASPPLSTRKP
jgi:hypothetical protein